MSNTDKPPFGYTLIWGPMKVGKTIAALNSPWQPVHIIDCENSSSDYFEHQERLVKTGLVRGQFTRTACASMTEYVAEVDRISKSKERYGTIALDTFGQISSWVGEDQFVKEAGKVEKQSQIVWGHVRDRLRKNLIILGSKCDLLVLTAHQREYPPASHKFSPRCNPVAIELTSISIRLERKPNEKLPSAEIGARLPFFPPKIENFTLEKLLQYIAAPADWDNLKNDEKVQEPVSPSAPNGYSPEAELENG